MTSKLILISTRQDRTNAKLTISLFTSANLRLCGGRSTLCSFTYNIIYKHKFLIKSNTFEIIKNWLQTEMSWVRLRVNQRACYCFFTLILLVTYNGNVKDQESRRVERGISDFFSKVQLLYFAHGVSSEPCGSTNTLELHVCNTHTIDTHLLQHLSSVSCLCSRFALFSVSTARGLDRLRYCSSSAVYLQK